MVENLSFCQSSAGSTIMNIVKFIHYAFIHLYKFLNTYPPRILSDLVHAVYVFVRDGNLSNSI